MALVLADRVKESTTTTGTGTVTLLGAATGFQSFAVIGNANTTYYTIAGQTTSEWEVGIGTYTSAGTLLARTTVLSNSAGTQPSALSFSAGTKDVFVTYPSSKSVNLDASGNATALGTPASGVVTNLTGTASININGTVGATTPTTGAFTSLDYSTTLTGGTGIVNLGSGQFYKDASGLVGIGTTSPSQKLVLSNAGAANVLLCENTTASIQTYLQSGGTSGVVGTLTNHPFTLFTNNTERMRIDTSGNVGIGTSSPTSKLHVVSSSGENKIISEATAASQQASLSLVVQAATPGQTVIYMGKTGATTNGQLGYDPNTNAMTMYTNNTEKMRIDSSGNVGIGTASPSTYGKFVVAGGDGNTQFNVGTNGVLRIAGYSSTYSGALLESVNTAQSAYLPIAINGSYAVVATGGTERARIDSSGKVGIGTSSPSQRFVVSDAGANNIVMCENSTSSIQMFMQATGASSGTVGTLTNHFVGFLTNNTERMRIDTSGNVGIGTSSPGQKLEVAGNALLSNNQYLGVKDSTGAAVGFPIFTGSNDAIFGYLASGSTGISTYQFRTGNNTERMRIDSSGNLLVNQTSQITGEKVGISFDRTSQQGLAIKNTSSTSPSNASYVVFFYAGTNTGSIDSTGTTTSYATTSDYRLKEDISPMTGALAKITALKPVTYKWKSTGEVDEGFIAHELQAVCPSAVTGEKDAMRTEQYEVTPAVKDEDGNIVTEAVMGTRTVPAYQGIDTSFLVATLTAAIQEQQALITALTTRITALEST